MSNKGKSLTGISTTNPLPPRELCSRSASQQQTTAAIGMGNVQSDLMQSGDSPKLIKPLLHIALETTMTVPKIPGLHQMVYAEGQVNQENEDMVLQEHGEQTEEIPIKSVVDMKDFLQVGGEEKLNLIMMAINKINTTFQYRLDKMTEVLTDEEDGVFPRLRECEQEIDGYKERVEILEEERSILVSDVKILKGIVTVQQKQIKELQGKVTDLRMRSMANNIIVEGILEQQDEEEETWFAQISDFFKNMLEMPFEKEEIEKVHRLGEKKDGRLRPMIVKCSDTLRGKIFQYTKNLKGKTNSLKEKFYIDQQLPEEVSAERKELTAEVARIKGDNADKPDDQKVKYKIKKKQLYVNNELQKKHILAPTHLDLLEMETERRRQMEETEIEGITFMKEKGNEFYVKAFKIQSLEDIRSNYLRFKLLFPDADHVVTAYKNGKYKGCCDDGEHSVGNKLLKVVLDNKIENIAVFAARKYQTRLGPKRFLIYKKATDVALKKIK